VTSLLTSVLARPAHALTGIKSTSTAVDSLGSSSRIPGALLSFTQEMMMIDPAPPKRIFMAADLSARCDRALARANLLARAWKGELIVAHVVHAAEVARRDRRASGVPAWRMGSQGRSGIARALLGSTAEDLLHSLYCDTLVVRRA
jgi:hypothetical protein